MNTKSLTILMLLFLITGCAKTGITLKGYETEQMIHYSQLDTVDNISDYVVYMNKGDTIGVRMTLDSHLIEFADEEINLFLKQKIYFRLKKLVEINDENTSAMSSADKQEFLKNMTIYLSPDAKRWASYTDIKSVEKIFGIKGGTISFGMGMNEKEGLKVFLHIKTMLM